MVRRIIIIRSLKIIIAYRKIVVTFMMKKRIGANMFRMSEDVIFQQVTSRHLFTNCSLRM
jgi:hypothetical protein